MTDDVRASGRAVAASRSSQQAVSPVPASIPDAAKFCAATGCPLIAPNGSQWTGAKFAPCPQKGGMGEGECPWWDMACATGGIQFEVDAALERGGSAIIAGPNKPKRLLANSRSYDCPHADKCSWQDRALVSGRDLCPPRDALRKGLDPRVCLF